MWGHPPSPLGRTMAPRDIFHPDPQTLWVYHLTWQWGPCRCDNMKDLRMGGRPEFSPQAPCHPKVLVRGRLEDATLLGFMRQKGPHAKGCRCL